MEECHGKSLDYASLILRIGDLEQVWENHQDDHIHCLDKVDEIESRLDALEKLSITLNKKDYLEEIPENWMPITAFREKWSIYSRQALFCLFSRHKKYFDGCHRKINGLIYFDSLRLMQFIFKKNHKKKSAIAGSVNLLLKYDADFKILYDKALEVKDEDQKDLGRGL